MNIGSGELLIAAGTGIVWLAVNAAPVVALVILWKRNTRLQLRVDALEKRLSD